MKIVRSSVMFLVVLGCSYASISNAQGKPELLPDRVVFGEKSLVMDKKGHWFINTGKKRILKDSYYLKVEGVNGIGMDDKTILYDKKFNNITGEKKYVYSCKFPLGDKNTIGSFSRSVKLVADNLLQVDIKITIPEALKVNYQHMTLMIPFGICSGKTVVVNGKSKQFSNSADPANAKSMKLFSGTIKSLSFTPMQKSTSLKMNFQTKNYGSIKESRSGRRAPMAVIRISPDQTGKISYLLDLR
jgi:hypothetical protein